MAQQQALNTSDFFYNKKYIVVAFSTVDSEAVRVAKHLRIDGNHNAIHIPEKSPGKQDQNWRSFILPGSLDHTE